MKSILDLRDRIETGGSYKEGKYEIKAEQIYEAIRGYVRELNSTGHLNRINALMRTNSNLETIDGLLSIEDAKKLEQIYDKNSEIYLHASYYATPEQIFKNGLRASSQPPEERKIFRTAKKVSSFLEMAGYTYHQGTPMQRNYILKIPKGEQYIWGTNENKGKLSDNYILPEYVVGAVDFYDKENPVFIENQEQERAKYKFIYRNGAQRNSDDYKINEENERA